MDSTIITAIAAACGSLVGAAATIVATWITQRTQTLRADREAQLRSREVLYGEFITEASRLTFEALSTSLEKPEAFVKLYGILGRIRLVAANPVLVAAEACCRRIVDLYARPNMTVEQIRVAFEQDRVDPIMDFSVVCRNELLENRAWSVTPASYRATHPWIVACYSAEAEMCEIGPRMSISAQGRLPSSFLSETKATQAAG